MIMTNAQIVQQNILLNIFSGCTLLLPVRIGFYLQKNIGILNSATNEIELVKHQIGSQFGILNDDRTAYEIPQHNIHVVEKELNELMQLEQDLPLHIFKLSDFDGIELTYQQMSAIMFMVEED